MSVDDVRPALQRRSQEGWARVLAAGVELLSEGGYEALTVAEVCRRARVSPPSLYARVDGREALFRAVYAHAMAEVTATEEALLAAAPRDVAGTTRALVALFATHEAVLRAVISRSVDDPALLAAGAAASRGLVERAAARMDDAGAGSPGAVAAARHAYTECAFRTLHGEAFWDEPRDEFTVRLVRESQRLA